jgi:large subunit ribosomal protein L13
MKHTKPTTEKEIIHSWHVIDAKGKVLGRLATQVAHTLMGKSKPYYVPNLDCGDNVVVINANDYIVTGKKDDQKLYGNYSGYPGGLKQKPLKKVRQEKPTKPIQQAVYGMLPKNKLRARLMTRLYIYTTDTHPHMDKIK